MSNKPKDPLNDFKELFTSDPKELQKKYQNEAYEKYLGKFRPYIHLWNLTNKDWVKQRNEIWDRIIAREKLESGHFAKLYWETEGRFFLRAKPRKSDSEIYAERMVAYIPFSDVYQIREIFNAIYVSNKAGVHSKILRYANSIYRAVPDEFHRVELIVNALYSKDYVAKKELNGKKETLIVSNPRDFIIQYLVEARNYIKRSEKKHLDKLKNIHNQNYTGNERSFVEITHDFFVGSLEHALDEKFTSHSECLRDDSIAQIKEFIDLITNYAPDVSNVHRDDFIEKSRTVFLENVSVNKVLAMRT